MKLLIKPGNTKCVERFKSHITMLHKSKCQDQEISTDEHDREISKNGIILPVIEAMHYVVHTKTILITIIPYTTDSASKQSE